MTLKQINNIYDQGPPIIKLNIFKKKGNIDLESANKDTRVVFTICINLVYFIYILSTIHQI